MGLDAYLFSAKKDLGVEFPTTEVRRNLDQFNEIASWRNLWSLHDSFAALVNSRNNRAVRVTPKDMLLLLLTMTPSDSHVVGAIAKAVDAYKRGEYVYYGADY